MKNDVLGVKPNFPFSSQSSGHWHFSHLPALSSDESSTVYLPGVGVLGGLSFIVRELQISISVTVESYTGFVNLWCRSLLTLMKSW